jgi:hypothetical protein
MTSSLRSTAPSARIDQCILAQHHGNAKLHLPNTHDNKRKAAIFATQSILTSVSQWLQQKDRGLGQYGVDTDLLLVTR